MAYPKIKKEEYKNIGGINQKASVYVTGDREVNDLVNYTFQISGAWTQRPGITNALVGNTLTIGASNRFNFGFQTYRYFFRNFPLSGASFSQNTYLQSGTGTYSLTMTTGILSPAAVGWTLAYGDGFGNAVNIAANITQTGTYENVAFYVSGKATFKANVDGIFYYGLPSYYDGGIGLAYGTTGTGSLSGTYNLVASYVDMYGYVGSAGQTLTAIGSGQYALYVSGMSFTQKALASGATAVNVYSNRVTGYGEEELVQVARYQAGSNATFTLVANPSTGKFGPYISVNDADVYTDVVPNDANLLSLFNYRFTTGEADCVESYANRLFWGISKGQNLVFWSSPAEFISDAQSVEPDAFIQPRNQNYPLTGLKSYNQSLILFFQKGVNRLTGTGPDNFTEQNLSDKYGLVSQRACVVWQERLWFLDEYQIIEFNGANFSVISQRVQSYLLRMNVAAAQKTAVAYYYEDRNEVWFAIPIDGSNQNNLILIYDYTAEGWYVAKSSSNFTMLQMLANQTNVQGISSSTVFLNNPRLYTGHPGGTLGYFGTEFRTDFDQSITLSFKTRYHVDQGPSTTMEWRRFFLDTGPWAGVTLRFNTDFYANFATNTISLTRTIFASGSPYTGPQQTRIDFGIPAKSLSLETKIATGNSIPIVTIYGYTIESRFLRRT